MTRAKQQAIEIQRALLSGADPRSIPALVDRITKQMATQAFAMNGDAYYMTFPDMTRSQIRTTASGAITGRGPGDKSTMYINFDEVDKLTGKRVFDHSLTTAFELNGTQAVNFMNFDMEDGRMLIDGVNAHLYHHALGTFDLDDKALNLPLMFKDANGKNRLAFMTMRQPTGFQERIFSRTDLSKKENVANILKTRVDDYLELFDAANDPLNTMNLNADERAILDQVRQAMVDAKGDKKLKGRIQLRGTDVDSADVEELLIKVRTSQKAKDMKFEAFMQMQHYDLAEMASSKSASQLGINKQVINYASRTKASLSDMQIALGRAPDAEPYYTRGSVFNILLDSAGLDIEEKVAKKFSELEGRDFANTKAIDDYIKDLSKQVGREVDAEVARVNKNAAFDQILQEISINSVPDPSNSLGLYINRQGVAVSMQDQVENILRDFTSSTQKIALTDNAGNVIRDSAGNIVNVGIEDFYRLKYSVGLIPPSNAVDMVKELVANSDNPTALVSGIQSIAGGRVIQQNDMIEILKGIQLFRSFSDVTDQDTQLKVIAELLGRYAGINPADPSELITNLAKTGEGAVASISEGTGFLRGMQILQGVSADELIGFDPALLDPNHVGVRIKSSEELEKIKRMVLTGYEQARQTAVAGSAEEQRLIAAIQELESANSKDIARLISLTKGTRAYNQYATTSRYFEVAEKQKSILEGTFSQMYRTAVTNELDLTPTPRAEFMKYTDEIAENLRGAFNVIRNLTDKGHIQTAEDFSRVVQEMNVSTHIFEMMSALANAKGATNILDVYDTMEASIIRKYGSKAAQVMREAISKEGAPDGIRI